MPTKLQVHITNDQGTVMVKLVGEARLDIEDAALQLNRVVAYQPKCIIVDASELTFLSSLGMSLLVNLRRTALKAGGTIRLAGLQPFVRDSMGHARLLELFQVYPDVTSAVAQGAPTSANSM